MPLKEFGINIHEEWKGMTQPVGLVVEPIVLDRLGIFPEKSIRVISDLQRRLESVMEEQIEENETYTAVTNFQDFCIEFLNWEESDLIKIDEFSSCQSENQIFVELEDYGEILKPDWIVPEINKQDNTKKVQILVKELKLGTPFDDIYNDPENKKRWEATHQQRFERLLKESENPLGIIWNGISLRLVYAPRGESSGHITFPLEPMLSVDGRPMIGALEMLLGPDRLFEAGASNLRLKTLMEQSRKEQNEVGTRLSEQVLEALWILVRGFDEAEDKSKLSGKSILQDLPDRNPNHVYGGLLTILLRLVFLLYVEDEELMPQDSIYVQNYSVSGLAAKLRADRIKYQSGMQGRYGAWSSLLSLFRLVYDGGGPFESYLPARHGELFDPDAYSFLEGRLENSSYKDGILESLPLVSDDVIEKVLNKLLILDGQILSYRSLDVEQIGSVYEGIMGFTVEKTIGPSVGILYKPPRQKIPLTFVINVDELFAQKGNKREKWIKDLAGVDLQLSKKIIKELKEVKSIDELCSALDNRLSPHTKRGLNSGKLILQPTRERRRTGSHYTPRTLTEPVVLETFRPWLELHDYAPTANEILNFKVCDPAMGSGAFLVASCRLLANYLVKAWEINGFPSEFDETYDKDIYARRLISQRCLYGVDKNPFAVNLAKLSLWLITLSKELPFTFVDHALKCGDSLVGLSVKDINSAVQEIQLGFFNSKNQVLKELSVERQSIFSSDNRDDIAYDKKRKFLKEQLVATDELRSAGDLLVASFFAGKNLKERQEKKKSYFSLFNNAFNDPNHSNSIKNIFKSLAHGDKVIKPFHWDLEFPEVFSESKNGFDAFIGNPPFAGKNTISEGNRDFFVDWLKYLHPESHGNSDLVAHFFRRCFNLMRINGSFGLISTNTIDQGDTRTTGLRWICLNNGTIYSAIKRYKWQGVAAVVVSIVHIFKGEYFGTKKLDRIPVDKITAFLLTSGGHINPRKLKENAGKSFNGSCVLGMGFTFDNSSNKDKSSAGKSSSISMMQNIIEINPKSSEVIYPYIGGEEVNNSPTHEHHRYVINFGERSEKECREKWPELMNIVEEKVKPDRDLLRDNADGKRRKQYWWQFGRLTPALDKLNRNYEYVLAATRHQPNWQVAIIDSNQVFSDSLVVFSPCENINVTFAILQSRVHEQWTRFLGSSIGDTLRYTPSDCFESFPFPKLKNKNFKLVEHCEKNHFEILETVGYKYLEFRSKIMIEFNNGLTNIYNRFDNPKENNNYILELRNLHEELDKTLLDAYGWSDISTLCGFSLDYVEFDETLEISEDIKKRLESGNLFFWDAEEAIQFENQIQIAFPSKKKLPWRYKFPNEINELIISRLLELNENYFSDGDNLSENFVNTKNNMKFREKKLSNDKNQMSINFD